MIMVQYKHIIQAIEQDINKTHDGTSMGKINDQLNQFAQSQIGEIDKLGGKEHLQIYDQKGNPYFQEPKDGDTHQIRVPTNELYKKGEKDLHLTHNHTTLMSDGMPTMLSQADTMALLEKNKDNKYIFQSITATTPNRNNSKITLLRKNKFSNEDHTQFKKATEKMRNEYVNYRKQFQETVMKEEERMVNNYRKEHGKHSIRPFGFHDDAVKIAIEKHGTLDKHFKKTGVYDEIMKANCKLRVTKQ